MSTTGENSLDAKWCIEMLFKIVVHHQCSDTGNRRWGSTKYVCVPASGVVADTKWQPRIQGRCKAKVAREQRYSDDLHVVWYRIETIYLQQFIGKRGLMEILRGSREIATAHITDR